MKAVVLVCLFLPMLVTAVHDLQAKYPFRATLLDENGLYYGLYWNFSIPEATIHFAVNVSTTGWIGFGISPNGQMPGSDVVIGWVADNGTPYFHDRFADNRSLPLIDDSQDWFLVSGEEENGFTILEFSRNWTTCDPRDLEIRADTSRVVWSFRSDDPTDPLGNTAMFHNLGMGATSLNLLGGLTNAPGDPPDVESFVIGVTDVTIPSDRDTTYWCVSARLPQEIISQERYITRVSPTVTPQNRSYVHHMLVYLCQNPLDASNVGVSGDCDREVPQEVRNCLSGLLIGAWAVGGEDFIYPENVAYPVGGPGAEMFAVIQMHYDNPELDEGVVDSSGLTFYYTSMPREHRAGILFLGHDVVPSMIIPPNATNYTVAGLCPGECTQLFPEDGIHIFGDVLHTHLAGHGLTLRHLRWNSECGRLQELAPIDQNLQYDFNYQQITHLPREVTVLPNDTLILECFYNTMGRTEVTLGGESTRQEMCLTFPVYYPRIEGKSIDKCASLPSRASFVSFYTRYGPSNPDAIAKLNTGDFIGVINAFNWSQPGIVQGLEDSILHNRVQSYCISGTGESLSPSFPNGLPEVDCPYQAVDKCDATNEVQPCCVDAGAKPSIGQAGMVVSIIAAVILSLAALL